MSGKGGQKKRGKGGPKPTDQVQSLPTTTSGQKQRNVPKHLERGDGGGTSQAGGSVQPASGPKVPAWGQKPGGSGEGSSQMSKSDHPKNFPPVQTQPVLPQTEQQKSGPLPPTDKKERSDQNPRRDQGKQRQQPRSKNQKEDESKVVGTPSIEKLSKEVGELSVSSTKKINTKGSEKKPVDVNESFNSIVPRTNPSMGGSRGKRIHIETNYLALQIEKVRKEAYHYDVDITIHEKGDKVPPKRFLHLAMVQYLRKNFAKYSPAFDGRKNLYSAFKFCEEHEDVVEVKEDAVAKELQLQVRIKLVNVIDMTSILSYMAGKLNERPQVAIQCLDVVFAQNPSLYATRVGRSFFSKPSERDTTRLGTGMELWHGLFQSACLGSKPFLNVDVAHKAFPIQQSVIDLVKELMFENAGRNANVRDVERALESELNPILRDQLNSFLRGLKVKYEIPKQPTTARNAKVNKMTEQSAIKLKFNDDNNKPCDVATYFKQQRKYQLRYPNLPCLHVGNPARTVYIPIELCEICPGQVINRKMNELQTAAMIKKSATPTWIRKQKIMEALNRVQITKSPALEEFGVKVSTDFTSVDARILDAPSLQYDRQTQFPRHGVWRAGKFFSSKNLVNWTILNLDRRTSNDNLINFSKMVQDVGRTLGMNISQAKYAPQQLDCRDTKRITDHLIKMSENQIELMFVVLPGIETTRNYALIKKIAEIDVGVLTQCLKSNTVFRINPATMSNILLKVNTKLNGTNHILAPPTPVIFQKQECLVIGADVTHPPPDSKDKPSIAAVAASCDSQATKYHFLWRLQDPKQEMIVDLKSIIVELLKYYKSQTGKAPQSILFFRDGVSEGQFAEVRRIEIQAIKDALMVLSPNYKPNITFIVVQKRHHTRFFPNERDGDPKNGNVPPGTCVDTVITYPTKMDFYLCSHASLQGVSRPTRYCLLLNEHKFQEDEIEALTYYLCHLFQRCTRSVSYPAPTYYAHLAASRAMHYFTGSNQTINQMSQLKEIEKRLTVKSKISDDRPMYFI